MAGLLTGLRRVRSTDRDAPCLVLMRKGSVPGILAPGTLPFLLWGNGGCGKGAMTGGSPKSLPMVDAGVLRGPAAEIWGSPCPVRS